MEIRRSLEWWWRAAACEGIFTGLEGRGSQLGVVNAQQSGKRGVLTMVAMVDTLGLRRPTGEVRWLQ